jgi:hypothetical protein
VRSSWFGGLLRWRARTSCHTDSSCDRNAFANSYPVSNFCAAQHSAPVRWIGSAHDETLSAAAMHNELNQPRQFTNPPVRDAVIRVHDEAGNVIETHEHRSDFKELVTPLLINLQRHHRMNFPHRLIFRCPSPI